MDSPITSGTEDEGPGALERLARDPSSRKRFLKSVGTGAAAGSFSLLLAACGGDDEEAGRPGEDGPPSSGASGDLAIVNYALTLEFLETSFYDKVLESGMLAGPAEELAKTFGEHEREHADSLRSLVEEKGGKPAAEPETTFPLESEKEILALAATVENLGAAAYLGQAAKIQDEEILAMALSIHTVEARHAAALNILIGKDPVPFGSAGVAKPAEMEQVLQMVMPFIAS